MYKYGRSHTPILSNRPHCVYSIPCEMWTKIYTRGEQPFGSSSQATETRFKAWKHARVVSGLKSGKDTMLLSSHTPTSLPDTVGKRFENTLLTRVLWEVHKRGLLRDVQSGYQPRNSTTMQLARLVVRVNKESDKSRPTVVVFLDMAKAFETV